MGPSNGGESDASVLDFDVEPHGLQTLDVALGGTVPTLKLRAKSKGKAVSATWTVDRVDAATISAGPIATAVFKPKGTAGGLVKVTATRGASSIVREVLIRLTGAQNGVSSAQMGQVATDVAQLTAGGGVGGVGGEGLGTAVASKALRDALEKPASNGAAQHLKLIYPYDGTVWPRGLPAPLLMWSWDEGDADAVRIEVATTSGSYRWSGTFGPPQILSTTGGKFIRHPLPQDVWDAATSTAGGLTADGKLERVIVKLSVAKGALAVGPLSQTWSIAPARLSGIIYYNSYGTRLAKNYTGAVGGDGAFGGAVLSIHVGDTAPALAAGGNGPEAQCRVCHSVAANGSRLVASNQAGNSFAYTLSPTGATETTMGTLTDFPGLTADGNLALLGNGLLLPLPAGNAPITPTGLSSVTTSLGPAAFSPDDKRVAFNPMTGPTANPMQKLVVMDFDKDNSTFSNAVTVVDATGSPAETRPGWPAFLPDGASLVFGLQSAVGSESNGVPDLRTRRGAKQKIVWTSASDATHVTPLDLLNGVKGGASYLPALDAPVTLSCLADGNAVGGIDADHGDDINLNYEPTVNPVASGGYAWVVFTSRRLYGSVATIPPFCSDPRGVDLVQNITTKKLWVAAIDLGAKPGADASHPAFYLPSQELLAGNARGFWTLDPCRADGASCESGDQCCGGYCTPTGAAGALVCGNQAPECARAGDRCEVPADCCDEAAMCVNNFCSVPIPVE